MKYDYCGDCYFYENEPGMCDFCYDGDQFEPAEADDDAYEKLLELSKPSGKVIPITPVEQEELEDVEETA